MLSSVLKILIDSNLIYIGITEWIKRVCIKQASIGNGQFFKKLLVLLYRYLEYR